MLVSASSCPRSRLPTLLCSALLDVIVTSNLIFVFSFHVLPSFLLKSITSSSPSLSFPLLTPSRRLLFRSPAAFSMPDYPLRRGSETLQMP
eukprot:745974-Hanusia_phi.AAC.1